VCSSSIGRSIQHHVLAVLSQSSQRSGSNALTAGPPAERPRIASVDGDALLPSIVGVAEQGELVVGKQARNQYILRPQETVRSVKRHMGDASWRCALGGREYDAPGVSALILGHLKQAAEARLGSVTQAVITVPAYFGEAQRRDTAEAGRQAGLDVVRILNEPTAAALLYSTISPLNGKVLVYDLGGGTFDVSVVQLEDGMTEVLASHGNRRLGGDDFDELLAGRLAQEFERAHGVRLLDAPVSRARLYRAAEEAKVRLSTSGPPGPPGAGLRLDGRGGRGPLPNRPRVLTDGVHVLANG
jgi:molecular chaperone DnaK